MLLALEDFVSSPLLTSGFLLLPLPTLVLPNPVKTLVTVDAACCFIPPSRLRLVLPGETIPLLLPPPLLLHLQLSLPRDAVRWGFAVAASGDACAGCAAEEAS